MTIEPLHVEEYFSAFIFTNHIGDKIFVTIPCDVFDTGEYEKKEGQLRGLKPRSSYRPDVKETWHFHSKNKIKKDSLGPAEHFTAKYKTIWKDNDTTGTVIRFAVDKRDYLVEISRKVGESGGKAEIYSKEKETI